MKFQNPILNLKQVFDISSLLLQNLQRAITKRNKMIYFYFSPGNLLLVLYKLSKCEAPSCNGF